MADAVIDSLQKPVDPVGFHFDQPFLRREILREGQLEGQSFRLLHNKFPFAPLHGLGGPSEQAFERSNAVPDRWMAGEQFAYPAARDTEGSHLVGQRRSMRLLQAA